MRALALILWAIAGTAAAQTDPSPVVTAERAAGMLDRAALALAEAGDAQDQIAALTDVVRAYEEGLAALRDGLRRAVIRERTLTLLFEAESDRLERLLGVLQAIERAPDPAILLHPEGPLGTARAGMIVSDVAPAIAAEAEALRAQVEELGALRALQESAMAQLSEGLTGAQEARAALNEALAERRPAPSDYVEEGAAALAIATGADTLAAFADMLRESRADPAPDMLDFGDALGALPFPVRGTVLRGYGQEDAAGIERPGLLISAMPRALVTAPWPATIRYAGPFLDYGNVIILEPQGDYLMVLAGLGDVYGQPGDVIASGAPIGVMGGSAPSSDPEAVAEQGISGPGQSETLYLEIRQAGDPVDPTPWFDRQQD